VLKALIEQNLCPVVISGASAGAFVAAIVGTRTDEEYLALFKDNHLARELTANRDNIRIGFGKSGGVDMRAIKREMSRMIPDMTFLEAYEQTCGDSYRREKQPAGARIVYCRCPGRPAERGADCALSE
jgi:NTE family protein